MIVYVTGIAGFIGSHVADLLVRSGHTVDGCDDLSFGAAENVSSSVLWRREPVQRANVAGSVDVVVHLAAISRVDWPYPHEVWRENLGGTVSAVRLARTAGAHLVFASSAAARDPRTEYGKSKRAAEREVLDAGGTVLRFANVWGDRARAGVLYQWGTAVKSGAPLELHGDGTQRRDFIHVSDAARAVVSAATRKPGGTIDVCTGVQTPLRLIARRARLRPQFVDASPGYEAVQDPTAMSSILGVLPQIGVDTWQP